MKGFQTIIMDKMAEKALARKAKKVARRPAKSRNDEDLQSVGSEKGAEQLITAPRMGLARNANLLTNANPRGEDPARESKAKRTLKKNVTKLSIASALASPQKRADQEPASTKSKALKGARSGKSTGRSPATGRDGK